MNEEMNYKDTGDQDLDELFRQNLRDFRMEPPSQVWRGISRKLLWKEVLSFNFSNVSWKMWSILAATLIIPTAAVLWMVTGKPAGDPGTVTVVNQPVVRVSSPLKAHNQEVQSSQTSRSSESKNDNRGSHGADPESSSPRTIIQPKTNPVKKHPDSETQDQLALTAPARRLEYKTSEEDVKVEDPAGVILINEKRQENVINSLRPVGTPPEIIIARSASYDSIITLHLLKGPEKFALPQSGWPVMVSLSLGVYPEKTWYKDEQNYSYMNYWVQGGIAFHLSRFSVETAIGMGYMLDQGKYIVDYKSHDSVGYFNNVVSFSTGVNNEITYNTSTQTLYDSLYHSNDYRTSNRYTYLRFPLLFGYRIFESDRFSVTLKAGPAFSLLIGSRESDPVIEYANARIIRVDETTPDRLKTNWQFWGDINIEMRLNRRFSLYLEPSWKYFLKPTSEQENPDKKPPWSAGIGVGVQINLDTK
jgi:hypothetical protein